MEATDESDMAEVTEDRGDLWSKLPPELLQLVCRNLADTGDLVRLRAVCTAWRDAAPASAQPPQLPWVLEPGHRAEGVLARPRLSFYSHSSGATYHVRVGGRRSWLLARGAFRGYAVATLDLARTMLYNPLTGDARGLPPAPYLRLKDNEGVGVFAVVDDGEAGGCVVVNTCTRTRHFAYCRPGVDAGWTVFDRRDDLGCHAYHGGRLYVNTAAGRETLAIDAATGAVEAEVAPPPAERFGSARGDYLVASRGRLLRAVRQPRSETLQPASSPHCFLNVYQLEDAPAAAGGGGKAAWTRVDTAGDAVLFFDEHGHGFSLEPNDAAGLTRDCVYFMHVRRAWRWGYRSLCRYSMEDRRVDEIVPLGPGDKSGDTWVLPRLCRSDE